MDRIHTYRPAAEPWAEGRGSAHQRGDGELAVDRFQQGVVDVAEQLVLTPHELSVEEAQAQVEQVGPRIAVIAHWPAFVNTMRGIAASEAARMTTRYTEPSVLASRPFVCRPM